MPLVPLVQQAFRDEQPGEALRLLVRDLHTQGWSKAQLYRAFLALFEETQAWTPSGDEREVLETCVLDALVGWCAPAWRLLPEEPDVREHTL
ncbi:hypothetical protein [Deinococcus maricopensis]|uniref:hypothetical protein n=1 Tax=Deinococcus maricopensis TaxID=309887 RepID=UPI0005C139B9|nr:hypothetical protein [Deinococcus maricopensis]